MNDSISEYAEKIITAYSADDPLNFWRMVKNIAKRADFPAIVNNVTSALIQCEMRTAQENAPSQNTLKEVWKVVSLMRDYYTKSFSPFKRLVQRIATEWPSPFGADGASGYGRIDFIVHVGDGVTIDFALPLHVRYALACGVFREFDAVLSSANTARLTPTPEDGEIVSIHYLP